MRNAKRAADSRSRPRNSPAASVTPERLMPGNSASAWAMPISSPSEIRVSSRRAVAAAVALGEPEDAGSDHEDDRDDDQLLAEERVDEVLEQQAQERCGDDAREQHEREPPPGVAREAALADRRPSGRDQVEDVAPEVGQQRRERAHVEHDHERRRC